MPLPKDPLTLHGGCNCGSIRYRVSVPEHSDRPVAPYHSGEINTEKMEDMPRIPFVLLDHCNDCRRATASVLPMCLVTEMKTVEVSVLSNDALQQPPPIDDTAREWQPLASVVDAFEDGSNMVSASNSTLGHYISSPDRHRWFCGRCGTPLAYSVTYSAYPEPWKAAAAPCMFDIWLGTLDRDCLEQEWLRPDHAVWCHFAVPWIADLAKTGATRITSSVGEEDSLGSRGPGTGTGKGGDERGESIRPNGRQLKTEPVPRHPLFMVDQDEGADVSEWLKLLNI
ncbi:hypothetical protein G647_03561 [Cladophialophora carrionii CBS 160.54]|uniref:CENP-V/GFA domain-containing protein n=1 Tax=Cladophialophora carrionii CBS 160.54 TaxID=1279043 RepID=V9DE01_9EURO|nr:uncharacterized protein G647_03561 [Cladophialophora carrionii CBS 160.54]ETI24192.1 hypothetical protein G647_03561 [Cladophialophora carrionii CBS 160.54]